MAMRPALVLAFLLLLTTVGRTQNVRCSLEVLRVTTKKLDNLSTSDIRRFLVSLNTRCVAQAEFSDWHNELLFEVLSRYTNKTLRLVERTLNQTRRNAVYMELSSPVSEDVDPVILIEKVNTSPDGLRIRQQIVESLEKAEAHGYQNSG